MEITLISKLTIISKHTCQSKHNSFEKETMREKICSTIVTHLFPLKLIYTRKRNDRLIQFNKSPDSNFQQWNCLINCCRCSCNYLNNKKHRTAQDLMHIEGNDTISFKDKIVEIFPYFERLYDDGYSQAFEIPTNFYAMQFNKIRNPISSLKNRLRRWSCEIVKVLAKCSFSDYS